MFENIGQNWVTDTALRKEVRSFLANGQRDEGNVQMNVRTSPELSHDPVNYDEAIVSVDVFHTNDEQQTKIGSVAVSFQTLVDWGGRDIMPSVDAAMVDATGEEEGQLASWMNALGDTLKAYADAFIELGPEPQSSIDAVERQRVRKFLSGETTTQIQSDLEQPVVVSAQMSIESYEPEVVRAERLVVDVKRKFGESLQSVGRVMVTVGRVLDEGIVSHLKHFDVSSGEMDAIDEHVGAKLKRYFELGPQPEIVPKTDV